jgi:GNAT superfamily N-acetyltransferase
MPQLSRKPIREPGRGRVTVVRVTELTTGWEADVPIADSLLRQFVHSYADRTAEMATAVGGRARRDDAAAFADLGSPFLFDNAVVLLRPPAPESLAATLDSALEFFPPHRAFVLLSVFPVPGAAFAERGLALMGHPPLMVRPFNATRGPLPSGLVIRAVRTPAELAAFHRVLIDGFGLDASNTGTIADPRLLDGRLHRFLGTVDGEPVAVAGSAVHHGLIEVDWVATVPSARGHGYGTALTWAAIDAAGDLPAVLIASDDGQPVYEKMGFLRLMRLTMYSRTGGDPR